MREFCLFVSFLFYVTYVVYGFLAGPGTAVILFLGKSDLPPSSICMRYIVGLASLIVGAYLVFRSGIFFVRVCRQKNNRKNVWKTVRELIFISFLLGCCFGIMGADACALGLKGSLLGQLAFQTPLWVCLVFLVGATSKSTKAKVPYLE